MQLLTERTKTEGYNWWKIAKLQTLTQCNLKPVNKVHGKTEKYRDLKTCVLQKIVKSIYCHDKNKVDGNIVKNIGGKKLN